MIGRCPHGPLLLQAPRRWTRAGVSLLAGVSGDRRTRGSRTAPRNGRPARAGASVLRVSSTERRRGCSDPAPGRGAVRL